MKVSISSQLSTKQKAQDGLNDSNQMREQRFAAGKKTLREAVSITLFKLCVYYHDLSSLSLNEPGFP